LRKRRDDVIPLAYHFISETVKGPTGKGIRIHPGAKKALEGYDWPGNARELLHVIQRALYQSTCTTIEPDSLPDYLYHSTVFPKHSDAATLSDYMRSAERYLIEQTIRKVGGNKTKAAEVLGIHRTLLYRKIRILGIAL
jgi:transcriptional regulator with PAS, ATPase and Fis domain